jgi:CheY-like chemotaxis protein
MEIGQVLLGAGHHVVGIADHQREAVAIANAAEPDLALIDIRLADGESGLDVATALGRLGVPSMFATGTCPRLRGNGIALACLHKPFGDRGLLDSVAVIKALIDGTTPATLPPTLHIYDAPMQAKVAGLTL